MNPICNIDIDSMECQKWMIDVYNRCRQLFNLEPVDPFKAWWHDDTPSVYKSDVQTMTAYDCHKLKRDLGREVAEVIPRPHLTMENRPLGDIVSLLWFLVLVLIVVIIIIIMCGCCQCGKDSEEFAKEPENPPEEGKSPTPIEEKKKQKKKHTVKGWMRHRCRPIFVHSESALERQRSKRQQEDRAHAAHTQKKIKKWTVERQHAAEEAKQQEISREEGENKV
ncbi:uncharacterized protein Dwil_GK19125 [Drosophila willistoni]|uniref:Uncharacterized protein n=1 Tax=Drosophila willistoni TaxID=7260 RepID=B4N7R1_DROWI|nr:uncharacterized protein LOC6646747 [Drosophila willistoni]EDW80400.2 uncharacterized protein Dwil_GK19125 [Drosophila willistoni]